MKFATQFVLLITLAGFVPPANAQWGYGYCERYPASCLVQGNLDLVENTVNQGRWARVLQLANRPIDHALDQAGGYVGDYYPSGYRDGYGRPRQVDCSKRKLNRREQETCEANAAERERREAEAQARADDQNRRAERAERDRRGGYHKSLIPFPVHLVCGDVDVVINPGRKLWLPEPSCNGGYRVVALEPAGDMPGVREDRELGDGRFRSTISEDGRGWVYFYDQPATRRGGAR